MERVRAAAVAGSFYAGNPRALERTIDQFLAAALPPRLRVEPRMAIVPHAGHVFSGPVAATAYAALRNAQPPAVLLLGPAHFLRFHGLATPGCNGFETPLGRVGIDADLRGVAAAYAADNPAAHEREHCLEVQLPFLQRLWPRVQIMPVLTGDDDPAAGARLVGDAADRAERLILISSDLSHYLDHVSAQRTDAITAEAIVQLRPEDVLPRSACGRTAIRSALKVARERGWHCQQLDLRTSGDTQGQLDRVVGYGSFVLGPASAA